MGPRLGARLRFGGFRHYRQNPGRPARAARARTTPVRAVQIAEALIASEGAAALTDLCGSGRKGDAAPLRVVMLRMFPDAGYDDLEAGLQLALTIAQLDRAESDARLH